MPPAPRASDGCGKGCRHWNDVELGMLPAFRHDVEESLGLGGTLEVEVMPPDDALRIAGLEGGFTHRPEFRDEHRDERVAEHVVREPELLADAAVHVHRVRREGWVSLQRVVAPINPA